MTRPRVLGAVIGAVVAIGAIGAVGTPAAHAATTVTFSAGNLSVVGGPFKSFVIGCTAGKVTVNAATTVPIVGCADVVNLIVRIGPSSTKGANTVDLRPMVSGDFSRLSATNVNGDGGSDRVYGSFAADTLAADGKVFGLGGNDILRGTGEMWGGAGRDEIGGSGLLYGGAGNDSITTPSELGVASEVNGGDGDDIIAVSTIDRAVFGGNGNDSINIRGAGRGVHPVIDGNAGIDTLTPTILRFNNYTVVNDVGVPAGSHRGEWEPGEYYVFKRVENFAVTMDGGTFSVVMQPDLRFDAHMACCPSGAIDVAVPGGVWAQSANQITAPGLKTVAWSHTVGFPPTVTVRAA